MRGPRLLLSASSMLAAAATPAAAMVGGSGFTSAGQQGVRPAQAPIVPGSYIIEFADDFDSRSKQISHARFYDELATANITRTMDLNFRLFRGASVRFHEQTPAASAEKLLSDMSAIKRVWPVRRYHVPPHTLEWAGNASAVQREKRASLAEDTFSPHVMTQIDRLHAQGITGRGVRVAVVDTGVDYLHPALGGCFGPGCLVSFGYDLVGDAYNGSNAPQPSDSRPPSDCNGHGTHVSGILAAQSGGSSTLGIVGAAPGVELGMFRVFGCHGDVNDDVLIAAFNRAYEAGADVITSSIGGASGWPEEAWSVAVTRIVDSGVPCTISAGNEGSAGLFFSSNAAGGHRVTAIASVDNSLAPVLFANATFAVAGRANTSFGYTVGSPANWTDVTLPLWTPTHSTNGNSTNSDGDLEGCSPLGNATNLSGYIVLLRRGTCLFTVKAQNAVAQGARYLLLYNNAPGTVQVDVSTVPGLQGVAMVSNTQGTTWLAALRRGERVDVAMTDPQTAPKTLVNEPNRLSAGFVSMYSSWGPTYEVDVKPQFSAPGGQILSTYPRNAGSYAVLSGTSMACPLAAAAYALVMEARRARPSGGDAGAIERLLASTARPNVFFDGTNSHGYLAPVPQQGAGLIQAYDAAFATTLLSVSSLSFNDSDHRGDGVRNFSLANTGHTSVVYSLSHVPAATAYTFGGDGGGGGSTAALTPALFPGGLQTTTTAPASLDFGRPDSSGTFDSSRLVIPAGQRRIVTVRLTPPAHVDAQRLPVFSGYIAINGSDGSSLSLPYLGVAGSLKSVPVLDVSTSGTYLSETARPPLTNATRGAAGPVPPHHVFLLPPPGEANNSAYANRTTLVQSNIKLLFGSPLLRADLLPLRLCDGASNATTTDVLGYRTIGSVASFPMRWLARDGYNTTWDGALADGTYAPAGLYRLVIRALRVFGDADDPSDYDVTETNPFRIRYARAGKTRREEC